ncbi:rubredoxin [Vibrio fluvialis]|uniref:Rubredoxin n=1 Tax=Vibrio fluvialis TaxID=676 RepID=A0AAX2LUF0_VIBFL|nr:rubredoxin [Vibrio fluvialis]AUV47383.1 rubredoxin [Vibrio fluvialis]EKO3463792.1 rubredoxin [Vibrio fluvialis]EKO3505900.1 rubredoxin [Vibrio fluvialis]EKO3507528.1 rubredoxin [Vibrio fluvialis]EKO4010532.1 rubredoxin [Vibrio fluvialis]
MSSKYVCLVCGYVHDDSEHNQTFESLPDDYMCPECDEGKDVFEKIKL